MKESFLSSVYLIIRNENNEILLQRRIGDDKSYPNFLALPAGHIHKGENSYEALIRETKEELDIDIKIEDIIDTFVVQRRSKPHGQYYDIFFELSDFTGTVKINEKEYCSELIWCDIDNLPSDMIKYERDAIKLNKQGIKFSCIDVLKEE